MCPGANVTPPASRRIKANWGTTFTQSCSDVKAPRLAMQQTSIDLPVDKQWSRVAARPRDQGEVEMLANVFRRRRHTMVAHNENTPERQHGTEGPTASNVRALATGAALAVSLDTSPAVLVSIYDYAHRYRDKGRRSA